MHASIPVSWILFLLLAGCSFGPDKSSIADQLEPEGVCWDVDLSDGLDDASTDELHNLFDCLNRTGNLAAFESLDAAMDSQNRDGDGIGLSLIRLSNVIATEDFDMLGLAGSAISYLQGSRSETETMLRSVVELAYGTPFSDIEDGFDVYADGGLEAGLLHPAIVLGGQVASDLLDGGASMRVSVNGLRESETLDSALCFMAGIADSEDEDLSGVFDEPLTQAADAWRLSENRDNNRWLGNTGNSIRDLIDEVIRFRSDPQFDVFREEVHAILGDEHVRVNTARALVSASESGHFDHLLQQLHHLSSVDVSGAQIDGTSPGDSALQVGTRLLHAANQPMYCDLVVFDVNIENMATRILQRLADLDSSQVESGLNFFVSILDGDIAPAILRTAAYSGICSGFTPELLADLEVLDRLNDPEVGNLVVIMHELLDAVYQEGTVDRLPELVNIVSEVHTQGLMAPIEEILRDLHGTDILQHAPKLFSHLLDPSNLPVGGCEPHVQPMNWDQLWVVLTDLSSGEPTAGDDAVEVLERTAQNGLLWVLVDRLAQLSRQPHSEVHHLADLITTGNEDVSEDGFNLVESFFDTPETWDTILMTIESPDVQDALIGSPGAPNRPVGFIASLVLSDTVTVMLQTIDMVLDTLNTD